MAFLSLTSLLTSLLTFTLSQAKATEKELQAVTHTAKRKDAPKPYIPRGRDSIHSILDFYPLEVRLPPLSLL